jgi:hypothetical protein
MILFTNHFKRRVSIKVGRYSFKSNIKQIFFELMLNIFYSSVKNFLPAWPSSQASGDAEEGGGVATPDASN